MCEQCDICGQPIIDKTFLVVYSIYGAVDEIKVHAPNMSSAVNIAKEKIIEDLEGFYNENIYVSIFQIENEDSFVVEMGPDPEEIRKEEVTNKIKKIKQNFGG